MRSRCMLHHGAVPRDGGPGLVSFSLRIAELNEVHLARALATIRASASIKSSAGREFEICFLTAGVTD